jgi:serine/threonine-protein kinase RsbW
VTTPTPRTSGAAARPWWFVVDGPDAPKPEAPAGDFVELRVPADPAYLAVVRTAAAGLAARLDLTLDEIEDLRIAVDEACALLLDHRTHREQWLVATFAMRPTSLDVLVRGPSTLLPERSSFAWAVLEALVGGVETGSDGDGAWIRLSHDNSGRRG